MFGEVAHDVWLLLLTRFVRLFAYGALSVVLVLYLNNVGLTAPEIGAVLTLTLAGDSILSLVLTTRADRMGRRRMLIIGAALMAITGFVFASTRNLFLLTITATIGVISPSGNEVGPFLSIEQAALSQVISNTARTSAFAWYTLTGSIATAVGSLCGGLLPHVGRHGTDVSAPNYRSVVLLYASLGIIVAALFGWLSPAVEPVTREHPSNLLGIRRGFNVVLKLSGLFALDSFGGGFVVQTFAAYWFYLRFHVDPDALGAIFFGANLFAAISALVAARLASRFGLVKTMVFTHLPSNVLLILIPLMPTLTLAVIMLLLRFSISQMDVPTRQSYTMAVVNPHERSAAAGVTGIARTAGAATALLFTGFMFDRPSLINLPFFIAGTLKITYDILLYRSFINIRPPEEEF